VVNALGKRTVAGQAGVGEGGPTDAGWGAGSEVGRTALREGIKVLAAKGRLASRTRTGTRVRPREEWSMRDPDVLAWRLGGQEVDSLIQELYEFRRATEPMAASLAAKHATAEDLREIANAVDGMAAAGAEVMATIEPDLRFHQTILSASGNEMLASLSSMIETSLEFSFQMCLPDRKLDALPLHRAVSDAISSRDAAGASSAMYALLDYSREWNEDVLAGMGRSAAS